jgi:hypothetical protein
MKRLSLAVLVVVLGATLVALNPVAKDSSDSAKALFSVHNYLSLEVTDGEVVDFGEVTPGESYRKANATTLKVESNIRWVITVDKQVTTKPSEAEGIIDEDIAAKLEVKIKGASGKGNKDNIKVDYTLKDLDKDPALPPGDYAIEVIFTATSK